MESKIRVTTAISMLSDTLTYNVATFVQMLSLNSD